METEEQFTISTSCSQDDFIVFLHDLSYYACYTEEIVCIAYLGIVRKSYADQTVLVVHLAMNKTVMSYQMCSYQGIILTALKASKNMTSALQVILQPVDFTSFDSWGSSP